MRGVTMSRSLTRLSEYQRLAINDLRFLIVGRGLFQIAHHATDFRDKRAMVLLQGHGQAL